MIQPVARDGFADAARYERARPGYPPDAVAWLLRRLKLAPGRTVVDLGAGTGKLTRLLAATGAAVVAVEPVPAMREFLASRLARVAVVAATAEGLPLGDGSVDAVVAAQAFHWFDAPRALAQAARVLRPGGVLGLVWNTRDERVGWVAELTRILDHYDPGVPRRRDLDVEAAVAASRRFTPVRRSEFRHDQSASVERHVERFCSVSFVATLPAERRQEAAGRLAAVLRHRVGPDGTVTLPHRAEVFTASRR